MSRINVLRAALIAVCALFTTVSAADGPDVLRAFMDAMADYDADRAATLMTDDYRALEPPEGVARGVGEMGRAEVLRRIREAGPAMASLDMDAQVVSVTRDGDGWLVRTRTTIKNAEYSSGSEALSRVTLRGGKVATTRVLEMEIR